MVDFSPTSVATASAFLRLQQPRRTDDGKPGGASPDAPRFHEGNEAIRRINRGAARGEDARGLTFQVKRRVDGEAYVMLLHLAAFIALPAFCLVRTASLYFSADPSERLAVAMSPERAQGLALSLFGRACSMSWVAHRLLAHRTRAPASFERRRRGCSALLAARRVAATPRRRGDGGA